jgi:hypothetical protein
MITAMRRVIPVLLLLLAPRHALAQTPFEASGGYALAHDARDQVTLPAGWIAGAAIELTPTFDAVADLSGQYKTVALVNADVRLSVHAVLGGIRASARLGRLTEFGQILAGVVRTSGSAFGSTTTVHAIGIQPGAGVDYPLTPRWAARAQLDVRLIAAQQDAQTAGTQLRFAASLVYRRR